MAMLRNAEGNTDILAVTERFLRVARDLALGTEVSGLNATGQQAVVDALRAALEKADKKQDGVVVGTSKVKVRPSDATHWSLVDMVTKYLGNDIGDDSDDYVGDDSDDYVGDDLDDDIDDDLAVKRIGYAFLNHGIELSPTSIRAALESVRRDSRDHALVIS